MHTTTVSLITILVVFIAYASANKPGICPITPPRGWNSGSGRDCTTDYDCRGSEKCCPRGYRYRCTMPKEDNRPAVPPMPGEEIDPGMSVTPGECPYVPPGGGTRIDRCLRDSECRRGKKCCMGAYGLECLTPIHAPAVPPPIDNIDPGMSVTPGECPYVPPGGGTRIDRCQRDSECRRGKKCCMGAFGLECLTPIHAPAVPPPTDNIDPGMSVTPGECPYVPPGGGTRIDRCQRDSECRRGKKCCMGAFGLECLTPIHAPAVPPPTDNIDPGMSVTPGECPYVPPGGGTRIDRCQRDSDCRFGKKCCMGAYGLECLRPKRRGSGIHRPMPLDN